jgi:predicted O-methyltransferase YrrM
LAGPEVLFSAVTAQAETGNTAAAPQAASSERDEHLVAVIAALDELTPLTLVWPSGLMNPGGPHRRLSDMPSPISIGEDECRVFGKVIASQKPEHCFIVGNAFGLSSAYIAHAMQANGGKSVVTLDSQTEGDGERCASIAHKLTDKLGLHILKNKKGFSPQDTAKSAEVALHDLIFIDGLHAHPQVIKDFEGLLPHASDHTIFVWHDFWMPGIPECVEVARQKGFRCLWVPTSCEMVLGTRDPEVFARLQKLFPAGEENRPAHSKALFYWLVSKWFLGLPLGLALRTAGEVLTGRGPRQASKPAS